jgi:hypothetical protein
VARSLKNGAGKESAGMVNEQSKTQVQSTNLDLAPASFPADVSARDFLELAEKLA